MTLELLIKAVEQVERLRARCVELGVDYDALMDTIFERALDQTEAKLEGKLTLLGDKETLEALAARHQR